MLKDVFRGFIATSLLIWLLVHFRVSFLQTQSSKATTAVAVFSRGQGDLGGSTSWKSELLAFNASHPLLDPSSPESQVLTGNSLGETVRLECVSMLALKAHVRSICIVGNGPLSSRQRSLIESCDVALRFNQLNTRLCGEKLDIWVLRHAAHVPFAFHGLNRTKSCTAAEALETARSVWFIDGAYDARWQDVQRALTQIPMLTGRMWVPLDTRVLTQNYAALVDSKGLPSTGWLGMMLALKCAPPGARVHVFGFNWSREHWRRHRMASEEQFARAMHDAGRIFIHWPICDGLRNCDHCAEAALTGKPIRGCYGSSGSAEVHPLNTQPTHLKTAVQTFGKRMILGYGDD